MNQDQDALTRNLRNMCAYISEEARKKAEKIRKDATDEATLCIKLFISSKIQNSSARNRETEAKNDKGTRRI